MNFDEINKGNRSVCEAEGGYLCGLPLSLLPVEYPNSKAVRYKPITATTEKTGQVTGVIVLQKAALKIYVLRFFHEKPDRVSLFVANRADYILGSIHHVLIDTDNT